jgi:hypothetical protein
MTRGISVLLALALAAGPLAVAQAAPSTLSVTVRPVPTGAQVTLAASAAVRFTLRQLTSPDRVIVDLVGLDGAALAGAQELVVPPVRAVRLARVSGGVQVIIDLTEPVLVDLTTTTDGRSLTVTLRSASGSRGGPAPALPTDVLRLQHLKPREVAAHLQHLLPGVQVRPDDATGSVIVLGTTEQLAQAKALVAALDAPPPDGARDRGGRPQGRQGRSARPDPGGHLSTGGDSA